MELTRGLWVAFELGRPLGSPGAPAFQRRVLRAALELLERRDGPAILEDFPEDAPSAGSPEEGAVWACPISFQPGASQEEALTDETVAEIERLAPWHVRYVEERGRRAPPVSGLSQQEVVRGLGQLAEGVLEPDMDSNLPLQEWVRLGCDELRTWYMEAAQAQPGRAGSAELSQWFWCQTALARLIADAAMQMVASGDEGRRIFGLRVMVPRIYMSCLLYTSPSPRDLSTSRMPSSA